MYIVIIDPMLNTRLSFENYYDAITCAILTSNIYHQDISVNDRSGNTIVTYFEGNIVQ